MSQGARPGATPGTEAADRVPGRPGAVAKIASTGWVMVSTQVGMLRDQPKLWRATLAPLALLPILCALASLFAQRVEIQWAPVLLTVLASVFAMVGIGALPSGLRLGAARTWVEIWRPRYAVTAATMTEQERYAARLSMALLALAALFAAPVAFSGTSAAWLLAGMGIAVVALYAFDTVRRRIAPLDDVITALCLGPGLVALTIAAQGHRMSGQDWLLAIAFGCMALALIEGRRLRATDEAEADGRRTLAQLIGKRGAIQVAGLALLLGFALVVFISAARSGSPGALLALTALPLSLSGLSGLAISYYPPARRTAATQLAQAYSWFGLALAAGIALTVVAQSFTDAVVHGLGG